MENKSKTIIGIVALKEAEKTGLITPQVEEIIKHEKLKCAEAMAQYQKLYRENVISEEQLQTMIKLYEQKIKALLHKYL